MSNFEEMAQYFQQQLAFEEEENKKLRKENEQLKEGIKEGLEFINDTSLWEINSYNTGEIYMRCRFCLADYKYGHNEYCPAKIYIERWGE